MKGRGARKGVGVIGPSKRESIDVKNVQIKIKKR